MIDENDHDDFTELENELRRLRPSAVPAHLISALAAQLEPGTSQNEPSTRVGFTAEAGARYGLFLRWSLPAAAALVFGAIAVRLPKADFSPGSVTTPASASTAARTDESRDVSPVLYKPVSAEKLLYGDREETFVTLDDGTPARQVRAHYLDTITWRNPRTNASLTWSVPREEIRVIPIAAY